MIVLNCLFPVFALILLGSLLKRYGLSNEAFSKTSDRLVYFVFFPAMLFWKIGGSSPATASDAALCVAALCALGSVYVLSCLAMGVFKVGRFQAGAFSQSCYRFNTYIGVAIVLNVSGETGMRLFGILIGFLIPVINVLSVSTLIWFSGKSFGMRERIGLALKSIVSNPLILSCIAGIAYARFVNFFPAFLNNTFQLLSYATLPLALFSIGGALTPKALKGHFKVSFIASAIKLAVYPVIGFWFFRWFGIGGEAFKVGMIYLALPASTAIYVLSSQLYSDTELASASIAMSTVLSFFSLSAVLLMEQTG